MLYPLNHERGTEAALRCRPERARRGSGIMAHAYLIAVEAKQFRRVFGDSRWERHKITPMVVLRLGRDQLLHGGEACEIIGLAGNDDSYQLGVEWRLELR